MPTYDYLCDACGHEFELFQSITAEPEQTCPNCKKRKLRRLFGTGAAIVFKGSGFYQTDYRSKSYSEQAKKEAKAEGGDQKSDSKSDGTKKKPTEGTPSAKSSNSPATKE